MISIGRVPTVRETQLESSLCARGTYPQSQQSWHRALIFSRGAWLQEHRAEVIQRLNADYFKPWFPVKSYGWVLEDLGDMTYEETVLRLVRLMYVTHEDAGSIYLCVTSRETGCAVSKSISPSWVQGNLNHSPPRSPSFLLSQTHRFLVARTPTFQVILLPSSDNHQGAATIATSIKGRARCFGHTCEPPNCSFSDSSPALLTTAYIFYP